MVLTNKIAFFDIIKNFEEVPYTQTQGMYEYHALSGIDRIKFFINCDQNPTIACYAHEKSFGPLKMIIIEGECYLDSNSRKIEDIKRFYNEITTLGYDMIEVCSNATYNFDYEIALRQAGYLRPVGQFSMPITKIIDLNSDIKYGSNWKRNIRKAKHHNLIFEFVAQPSLDDCADYVRLNSEMTKRKTIRNPLSKYQIAELCKYNDFFMYYVIYNNQRIAGLITHQRNSHAGSLLSASNQEALQTSASYFMYIELFKHLKNIGINTFDVEKLVPATDGVNNVFIFKNGVEGVITNLNGEWACYKKKLYRPMMYFVKKYLLKKREL